MAADIAAELWGVLSDMSPYLLLGFLVAGALSVLISAATVERHLGGRGLAPVIKASALGVPLPLCSCGVIPVASSLRRHGASRGATTAFLISTPQTGVDSIFVTYSLLGGVFAIFRPIAALIGGVLGGAAVSLGARDAKVPAGEACRDACCVENGRSRVLRALVYGFWTLPRDIGRALVVGLVLAALISALVPKDFFAGTLGGVLGGGIAGMLLMMALGVPVYVCATASVPLAWALIEKGVSPGTALVFLMTGPATNAATIVTIGKVMGRRTAVIYLLSVAATALAAGLTLDALFRVGDLTARPGMGWMLPAEVKSASAVVLLGVLGAAALGGAWRRLAGGQAAPHPQPAGDEATLRVEGMTCSHCAGAVRRALLETAGVTSAEVDLAAGVARVTGGDLDADRLARSVEQLGYRVRAPAAAQGPPQAGARAGA